jgi:hypothetical protein
LQRSSGRRAHTSLTDRGSLQRKNHVSLQLSKFCIPFTASRDEIDMSLFLGAILRTTGSNIPTSST